MSNIQIVTNLIRSKSTMSLVVSFLILSTSVVVHAQKETVLHSFLGGAEDGQWPYSNLLLDGQGNLYGTTSFGGPSGNGTVFKFKLSSSDYSVLYSFGALSAHAPYDGVVRDPAGNLFGTLECGGTCDNGEAPGAVFELTPSGVESVLAQTSGPAYGNLVRDSQGNLYGTSLGTYPQDNGTVFEVTTAGQYNLLYAFAGSPDGSGPYAGLIRDRKGGFYGTTFWGGIAGEGTIFELTASGAEKVLYSFCSLPKCTDGKYPYASLVEDANGNLYGTTVNGGSTLCYGRFGGGCGVVFELTSAGKLRVLHQFKSSPNDGENPNGGLVLDASGNLYGTTTYGGKSGWGTVFKITPAGKETILYNFSGGADGSGPYASLLLEKGNLYGTTTSGGTVNANCTGCGVVFRLTP